MNISFVVREFSERLKLLKLCLLVYSSDRLTNAVYSADTLVARSNITSSVIHPCDH